MIYRKHKTVLHKNTYEQFEKEFIKKHSGDILDMFKWINNLKQEFNPNSGMYERK